MLVGDGRVSFRDGLLTAVGVMIGMKNTASETALLIVSSHNSPCAMEVLSCHSLKSPLVRPSWARNSS